MRKLLTLVILISLSLSIKAQTSGELSVSVQTSTAGGGYSPKHILAIWIEDENNNFVKTLMAYAQTRITYLNIWENSTSNAGSVYNRVDAITGPTQNGYTTRVCTWDGTDVEGNLVPDGTYYVWMELTDKNSTGNYSSFSFTKGVNSDTQNPTNQPSFSSINIEWVPDNIDILEAENDKASLLFPNPSSDKLFINSGELKQVKIHNIQGKHVYTGNSKVIDISILDKGLYIITVETEKSILTKKLMIK